MSFQIVNKNNKSKEEDSDLIINTDDLWITNDLNTKKSDEIRYNKQMK